MSYTPSTLSINYWTVPLTVNSSDAIADLDDTVNAIFNTNSGSLKNHFNTELDRVKNYLSSELTTMYGQLGESMAHKWAEEAEDVEVSTGEYSAHHWAIKAGALMSAITASATELNVLDGITSTTTELNKLHGVTATTADINKTSNLTSGTYTPTGYAVSNCSLVGGDSTLYSRVGNVVTVSGYVYFTPSATGELSFSITLPIASNFLTVSDANGVFAQGDSIYSIFGNIYANSATDRLDFRGVATSTYDSVAQFTCQYIIQ